MIFQAILAAKTIIMMGIADLSEYKDFLMLFILKTKEQPTPIPTV